MGGTRLNYPDRLRLGLAMIKLGVIGKIPFLFAAPPSMPARIMGLTIANPVGMAAGMDRTGRLIEGARAAGFGFVEIGSVTPDNLHNALRHLGRRKRDSRGPAVGVNIGCARGADENQAIEQDLGVMQACLPLADYLVLNPGPPITEQARAGCDGRYGTLFSRVAAERDLYRGRTGRRPPIAVKIRLSDGDEGHGMSTLQSARNFGFDGAVLVSPPGLSEPGILDLLADIRRVAGSLSMISVGGIANGRQVRDRLNCGVSAVQIFSGIPDKEVFIACSILSDLSEQAAVETGEAAT